jgi:hypothetical protein
MDSCHMRWRVPLQLKWFRDILMVAGNGTGVIKLMRSVMSVSLRYDMLVIIVMTRDGTSEERATFTPRFKDADAVVICVGDARVRVTVTWSAMPVMCIRVLIYGLARC